MLPLAAKRITPSPDSLAVIGEGRDLDALASIAWAGILSTSMVERLHFPSRRKAQRRLRALLDHGLVRAHQQGDSLHKEQIYTATPVGIERLAEHGMFPDGPPRPIPVPRPQKLAHALLAREVFVAFVLAERTGVFTLEDFLFENDLAADARFKAVALIPDGVAVVAQAGREEHIGVEVDRGTETTTTLRAKFIAWTRVLVPDGSSVTKAPSRLLVVSIQAARRATLSRLVAEAGLASRARVVLLDELSGLLATGWPAPPTAPAPAPAPTPTTTAVRFRPLGRL